MRSTIVAIIVSGLVSCGLRGQTTGVPFVNDYTLTCVGCGSTPSTCFPPGTTGGTGGVSGSTSPTPLFFNVAGGGTFTITVTCVPGSQVFIFTNPCPCVTCFAPMPPVCVLAFPLIVCGGTTNQSVDLDLSCTLSNPFSGFASGGGVYSVSFTLPSLPGVCITGSTQAAITSNIACAAPVIVSQAYNVTLGG